MVLIGAGTGSLEECPIRAWSLNVPKAVGGIFRCHIEIYAVVLDRDVQGMDFTFELRDKGGDSVWVSFATDGETLIICQQITGEGEGGEQKCP